MTLGEVLAGVRLKQPLAPELARSSIEGLEYDSRRVKKGALFFAFPGARADGRGFAGEAVKAGAVAVVSELPPPDGFRGSWVQVEHGRHALALAARNFFQKPDERISLTGITGTNGKTTTAYLVDSILRAAGNTTALIGTIEYHLGDRVIPAVNTTPESLDLYRLFAELEKMDGTFTTMEVSSHALALGRVHGLHFHTAVFTNLTRDHLDFHRTMEEYFAAKQMLFTGAGAPAPPFAVINRDDEYGARMQTGSDSRVLWYGLGKDATVRARHISSSFEGLRFEVQAPDVRFTVQSPLIGRINVYNILAACGAGLSYGLQPATIARGIAQLRAVPGRFERVDEGQPFVVVVDYAHTDDALRNVISMARSLEPKRVVTLFGCGGDRDRTKRPIMGQVAAELSDFVVLTSDNPRSEDPLDIMNDVLVGLRRKDTPCLVEPDRAAAIRRAIEEARPGDILILAGKGHETYQVLKDRTIPFDDREVAREVLRSFGYRPRPDASS
ncbi:MAG TPA: UDP-N-acetylmuramoyl-L-alanyl-D-glutamate--2,6-diaminopimelate ligase [Bryobacteraceae bacterium]|nr:UDP-N-acetylmuramoyl-L-alanyl-D-glutamate--2,6-diaminopimelate ligase [Bryobacteraceae bacterium]